jgi:hypothetical protein
MILRKCCLKCSPTFFSNFKHGNLHYFWDFQPTGQRKESPNRRKFAQSGHPGYEPTVLGQDNKQGVPSSFVSCAMLNVSSN